MYEGQLQNNVSYSLIFCDSQYTRANCNVFDHSTEGGIFQVFSQCLR
jgi:hypothetical protein